jgi:transcriptional regulator with XRE-family HTH domain
VLKERLVKLRTDKGLSQYDLAKTLGLSRGQISNYELGSRQPDYATLSKIADFFGVSTDYLLGRPNEKRPSSVAESPSKYHVELKWNPNDPIEKSTNEIAQMLEQAVRLEEMTEEEALKVLELAKEHIKIAKK